MSVLSTQDGAEASSWGSLCQGWWVTQVGSDLLASDIPASAWSRNRGYMQRKGPGQQGRPSIDKDTALTFCSVFLNLKGYNHCQPHFLDSLAAGFLLGWLREALVGDCGLE